MEYFDVVDGNDNVVGKAPRSECHKDPKLVHRTVHVFVFNDKKELFIQKRGEKADLFPGCYDSSVSGHVESGNDYDGAAFRETVEELGFEPEMLIPLFKVKLSDSVQTEFVRLYFCFHKGKIKPKPGELAGGMFMAVEEIRKRIDSGENFTSFFKKLFEKYYKEFWRGE
jgi:isopentenyl-diphosphate delta-isomerase